LILEMGPDPTWTYFWPAVNKRPTSLWPGYFLAWSKGEKMKNLVFLGEIFQTQTQSKMAGPTQAKKNWPGHITAWYKMQENTFFWIFKRLSGLCSLAVWFIASYWSHVLSLMSTHSIIYPTLIRIAIDSIHK